MTLFGGTTAAHFTLPAMLDFFFMMSGDTSLIHVGTDLLNGAYRAITILMGIAMVTAFFYGLYGVYYAYIKTKDERQKFIVLRSAARAFTALLAYYGVQMIVTFAHARTGAEWVIRGWQLLQFGIDAMPVAGMLAVFGAFLFFGKRKAGGD